jgi:ABC-2 type transport system permease protein
MSAFGSALAVEWLKARRSRVPWGVAAGFSLAPLVCALFMVILKDPDSARRLGLLGTKAAITAGTADWPTMLSMLAQAIAVGGGILFAFLTAWLFGREFSDRTVRTLLATPTPRWTLVAAKMVVITAWGVATMAWVIALGFFAGALVGLPGWSGALATEALWRMVAAAVLTLVLQSMTAFFAGVGRGFIAPLGWAFATIAAAQILAVLGLGAAFPWAVPALVSGAAGPHATSVPASSYLLVVATGAIGLAATIGWWSRADQTG